MITVNKCPMCCSEKLEVIKTTRFFPPGDRVKDNLTDMKQVRLWILFKKILNNKKSVQFYLTFCKSCGFIFTNPRFTAKEISIKYATVNELGTVKKRFQEYPASNLDVRARRVYSLIRSLREAKGNPYRVLDYGGASGYNLVAFAESGSSCHILDYEKWNLPSGTEYLGKDLTALQNDDFFDVILLLHTLEHTVEPKHFLQDISVHLPESGLLYVEVPLGCFREYKNLAEPLTHLNFFSEESIYKGLRSIGLDVVYLSTKYEWVTHGKMWCINIAGNRRKGVNSVTKYKTTKYQMNNISYYWQLVMNKAIGNLKVGGYPVRLL